MRFTVRGTLSLAAISAVARTPAFLIPVLLAAVFGAGHATDAYFVGYSAVLFLGGTLAQGIEQAVGPFAARVIHEAAAPARYLDRAAARSALAGLAVWVVGIPAFATVAPAPLRGSVLGYGILFTSLAVFWCATAVYTGALVSQWKIGAATGSMLWRGFGALLGIALVPLGGGLWTVALGLGVGEGLRLWWTRRRLRVMLPTGLRTEVVPALGPLGSAAAAQVAAGAAIGGAPLIERLLALPLGIGAVSHIEYALRLLVIPSVVFEGAILPLLLARWTRQIAAEGNIPPPSEVMRVVAKGLGLAVILGVALAFGAPLIVSVLLGHGRFTVADEGVVASLLQVLSLAFVANMGAQMLERHYIASTRNRTLAGLSVARAVIRVGTMWWLLPSQGLLAWAIGFTVSDWCYLIALAGLIRQPARAPAVLERTGHQ